MNIENELDMEHLNTLEELNDAKKLLNVFLFPDIYSYLKEIYEEQNCSQFDLDSDLEKAKECYDFICDKIELKDMANLPESVPFQLISEDVNKAKHWEEIAVPLVKKVFEEINESKNKVRNKSGGGRKKSYRPKRYRRDGHATNKKNAVDIKEKPIASDVPSSIPNSSGEK